MEHPITVYITADTLISSLGANTQENIKAIREYQSGITRHEAGIISDTSILAATIKPEQWERAKNLGVHTPGTTIHTSHSRYSVPFRNESGG